MADVRKAIEPKSDQLNSDDLLTGEINITIKSVTVKESGEQPIAVSYEGDKGKPYKPCKSMTRVMAHFWGADSSQWVGKSLTLYRDPSVKWGGVEIGGIRISHMSHIRSEESIALTATKGSRKLFTVKPLKLAPTVDHTALLSSGEAAAAQGMETYKRWFTSLSKDAKLAIEPSHEALKKKAAEADTNQETII